MKKILLLVSLLLMILMSAVSAPAIELQLGPIGVKFTDYTFADFDYANILGGKSGLPYHPLQNQTPGQQSGNLWGIMALTSVHTLSDGNPENNNLDQPAYYYPGSDGKYYFCVYGGLKAARDTAAGVPGQIWLSAAPDAYLKIYQLDASDAGTYNSAYAAGPNVAGAGAFGTFGTAIINAPSAKLWLDCRFSPGTLMYYDALYQPGELEIISLSSSVTGLAEGYLDIVGGIGASSFTKGVFPVALPNVPYRADLKMISNLTMQYNLTTLKWTSNWTTNSQDPITGMVTNCKGSIGDFVWYDANRNGIQDTGEPGIPGVMVVLKDNNGNILQTDVTDANGYYNFTELCAGTYTVVVDESTLPAGYIPTTSLAGSDRSVDSNGSPATVTLPTDSSTDTTIDFGYVNQCTGTIGDFVWHDLNRNGIQDAGEPGIDGVTVYLYSSSNLIATTTTGVGPMNQHGYYQFTGLCAGNYTVVVDQMTLPPGYTPTSSNVGSDFTIDSNGSPAAVTLPTDNSSDETIDFGYVNPCAGTIGDFIWHDLNRNGIQDAGEPGIDGVTVYLYSGSNLIATTTTGVGPMNQHGYYQFTGVCAGDYTVVVEPTTLPAGYTPTGSDVGSDRTVDSNGSPATVTLPTDNSSDETIDFGYLSPCTGTIGDFIWHDLNRNGIQDAGEPGIDGVTVNLYSGSNLVATTITGVGPLNQHGYYQFTGLCAGNYIVVVDQTTLPPGYTATAGNVGSDRSVDSNGSPAAVTLPTDNSSDETIDFGYVNPCTGTIGDFIWHDLNRNGTQDSGEPGINGVIVNLKDTSGTIVATTTTAVGPGGQNGYYQFTGLCAGSYTVEAVTPQGYQPTSPCSADQTIPNDSNCIPAAVDLQTDNSTNQTIDFGFVTPCTGSIGDFVWNDLNRNGIQDNGEPGINGVVVNLKDSSGTIIATTTTNANGYYQFTGLCAGNYTVEAVTPQGYQPTSPCSADQTIANDSNCIPAAVNLPGDNSTNQTIDFGFVVPCSGTIGDFVWNDLNKNGLQDSGEPGIGGVTVYLKDLLGNTLQTATTASNGSYSFTGLCPGTYKVEVVTPSGYQPTTPCSASQTVPNDSNCSPATVDLNNNSNQTIDFGFFVPCTGSIGDFVWNDLNKNGLQDSGEPGIGGVTVYLKDLLGNTLQTATTASNGSYSFTGLCPGTYKVEVVTPSGYQPTTPCSASQTVPNDSNCSPATVDLNNNSNQTIDFGFFVPCTGSIGDFVWKDTNGNGIQDTGEPGIANVKVILKDANGNVVATTLTDSCGKYKFTGLCAGCYTVQVDSTTVPAGLVPTTANVGTNDAVDSDSVNGAAVQVCLTANNSQDLTIDFGYKCAPVCSGVIGDFVWKDTNGNGIQDSGESGIANVKVYLKDANVNVIASTTTDSCGKYKFTGLCAGCYYVDVDETTIPSGYVPTTANAGSDDTKDSDSVNGAAVQVCLSTSSSQNLTIDFGFKCAPVCSGVVGDFVWKDTNGNGIQDSGEPGIANVKVYLKDANGNVIASTTTDSCGKYKFTGLCAGCYYVDVDETTIPSGYVPTTANAGSDDTKDSDSVNGAAVQVCLSTSSSQNLTIDFGFKAPVVCTGVIGDFVWFDKNSNGIQDSGELGIAGVKVILKDASGNVVATTLTDSCGKYKFTALCAGCYSVQVDSTTVPTGYIPTAANMGSNDSVDSDSVNGAAVQVCLAASNSQNLTIDFGFKFAAAPPGCGTPGFWKNHPEAWPCTSIVIGGKKYTRDQAIAIMSTPNATDVTYTLFRALVSAKLNVLIGNDSSCISSYITKADQWLTTYPVGSGVSGGSSAWTIGNSYYTQLDNYNNGLLCAPHRLS